MGKTNILITSAGRRVSLVREFQQEMKSRNIDGNVYCTDLKPDLSAACQIADGFFAVQRVTSPDYINELIQLCLQEQIVLIVPTIDTELEVLAENCLRFEKLGIQVLISDTSFVKKCRDKRLIHQFFDEIGIERAAEYNRNNYQLPVFVKPSDGSRSQGIYMFQDKEEIPESLWSDPKNMFLEYFPKNEYDEFTIDIYFNKDGKLICVVPRERIIVKDGEVNTACARKNGIVELVKDRFSSVKGLIGCITFQAFKHKEKDRVIGIEVNPRFGGGFPLSYNAGANFPGWILDEYILNKEIDSYDETWQDNTLMIRYDQEVIVHGYKG